MPLQVLGRSRSVYWALVRVMVPCIVLSAFLNNTPVVSLLTPILLAWSRRSGVPAKKLLIPLSYAAVLGGTITLIGGWVGAATGRAGGVWVIGRVACCQAVACHRRPWGYLTTSPLQHGSLVLHAGTPQCASLHFACT
jgi:hypothetical protein